MTYVPIAARTLQVSSSFIQIPSTKYIFTGSAIVDERIVTKPVNVMMIITFVRMQKSSFALKQKYYSFSRNE